MTDAEFRARVLKALELHENTPPEDLAKKFERMTHERHVLIYMVRRACREMTSRLAKDLTANLEGLLAGK